MNTSIRKVTIGTVATVTLSLVGIACQDKFLEIPATGPPGQNQTSRTPETSALAVAKMRALYAFLMAGTLFAVEP